MNNIYIVISILDNATPDVEVYTDKQYALGRAAALAHFGAIHHPEWIEPPKERTDINRSPYWIFLQTSSYIFNRCFVAVYCRNLPDAALVNPDTVQSTIDMSRDPSLPVGWNYSDKAIIFKDLLNDPYSVRPIFDLSKSQQWALVTSRVRKNSGFSLLVPGLGTFTQKSALHELENKTDAGQEIVTLECAFIDKLLSEQKDVEEESS